jgi:hypothetical protein
VDPGYKQLSIEIRQIDEFGGFNLNCGSKIRRIDTFGGFHINVPKSVTSTNFCAFYRHFRVTIYAKLTNLTIKSTKFANLTDFGRRIFGSEIRHIDEFVGFNRELWV